MPNIRSEIWRQYLNDLKLVLLLSVVNFLYCCEWSEMTFFFRKLLFEGVLPLKVLPKIIFSKKLLQKIGFVFRLFPILVYCTIGYIKVFIPKYIYLSLFSYSILIKDFELKCSEGTLIKADFLNEVRYKISLASSCSELKARILPPFQESN